MILMLIQIQKVLKWGFLSAFLPLWFGKLYIQQCLWEASKKLLTHLEKKKLFWRPKIMWKLTWECSSPPPSFLSCIFCLLSSSLLARAIQNKYIQESLLHINIEYSKFPKNVPLVEFSRKKWSLEFTIYIQSFKVFGRSDFQSKLRTYYLTIFPQNSQTWSMHFLCEKFFSKIDSGNEVVTLVIVQIKLR